MCLEKLSIHTNILRTKVGRIFLCFACFQPDYGGGLGSQRCLPGAQYHPSPQASAAEKLWGSLEAFVFIAGANSWETPEFVISLDHFSCGTKNSCKFSQ